ncbi:outer membrane protein assembly factor BamB family protein [Granulicella arctica]|uniref:outer membrane protein assembly factor BamB family protein n=1 Tax=Granulicella arctica TaxID=940613 RepID=UPI0021E09C9B|nr:PQQ-binding-like beta-propeller repeat protein [Granulicella arctica]
MTRKIAQGTKKLRTLASLATLFVIPSVLVATREAVYAAEHTKPAQTATPQQTTDWPVYGGQPENDHYSSLTQINKNNVSKLQVAWSFDSNEVGGLQTSPLIVGRMLYAYTPTQKIIALNAATGKTVWTYDSGVKGTQPGRGLTFWKQGAETRLFAGVMNFLYALDPATGKPIDSFGEHGRIDLRKNLRGDYREQSIVLTTPGVIYKNLIIVGGRNPETLPSPPGDIRAFDVRTGALQWAFHTIPHPGEFGYETWPEKAYLTSGAANNWAGMAVDVNRGIVYAPTGSSVSDFYGGDRIGDDLFANTLLALDAATGKRLWHFQGVHHDIWDRDFPSPPSLLTVQHDGQRVDALAQTTKQGYLYLFDRVTGKPLFPIEERPVPESNVPGEKTSPTQPRPTHPEPLGRQILTNQMLTERTPAAHQFALDKFQTMRSEGQFVPLSVGKQTIVFPGFDGGAEWGGSAVDPRTGVIYVNTNEMAWTGGLVENKGSASAGETTYRSLCVVCHGVNREGAPPAFPSLVGVGQRLSDSEISSTVRQGKGRMPAFTSLNDEALTALLEYVKHGPSSAPGAKSDKVELASANAANGQSYEFTGYRKFLDQDGYPAISPPWGTLNAIDLNTGKYLWKIPFGEYPELAASGMKNTGSENYGGPVVTAGGLLFIGATIYDRKMHAYDSETGKLLWQFELPLAGLATPATYMVDGKQYVVIAAGGGRDPKSSSGGRYIAFALP